MANFARSFAALSVPPSRTTRFAVLGALPTSKRGGSHDGSHDGSHVDNHGGDARAAWERSRRAGLEFYGFEGVRMVAPEDDFGAFTLIH